MSIILIMLFIAYLLSIVYLCLQIYGKLKAEWEKNVCEKHCRYYYDDDRKLANTDICDSCYYGNHFEFRGGVENE